MNEETARMALGAAYWVTASPHEWVWTHEQQVAMARYCIRAATILGESVSDLEQIVCVKPPDEGVILLSSEGKTHTEEVNGRPMQVYDHENFSPLGDALIALHTNLSSMVFAEPKPA